ncbi:OmpA family protein [Marinomonas polaris]|jgi:outer membrane protein OmpA-like peptidoglycan-associated protein|uniref:OmpA family protein n=1 Tax=Marinomonas TaxID=28253 RepID=UPI000C1E896E|nr:OmpA family protein [Marinomonas sp. BSi20584]PJE54160.1 thrombospondin [Marinomonas sp. BSi20584]|tara:strand:+ start:1022 stop:1651 length:630 start_codon:yes stop_codon:yes gene_type:complete
MKTLIKTIALTGTLLVYGHLSAAESLYASNVQSRLADADRDGVIDARDLCPGTTEGAAVDNYGCPNQTTKLLSVELNILFDTGKADIKQRFYSELKDLAKFLKEHPASTVVIEGHTDSQGSAELNQELSQQRASAIADVLVDSFRIQADRVKGIGYGATRPIADNDTEDGRKLNRRVVAEVFAKQQFANERWTIYSVDKNGSTALNNRN